MEGDRSQRLERGRPISPDLTTALERATRHGLQDYDLDAGAVLDERHHVVSSVAVPVTHHQACVLAVADGIPAGTRQPLGRVTELERRQGLARARGRKVEAAG